MTTVTVRRPNAEIAGWRTSLRQGGQDTEWLPILEIGPTGQLVGVTRTQEWVSTRRDGFVAFPTVDIKEMLLFLRLVELEPRAFFEAIGNALVELGLSRELLEKFPTRELIDFSLNTRSNHWILHALRWIETLDRSLEHLPALREIVNGRWAEQRLRHRARRLLKDARVRE